MMTICLGAPASTLMAETARLRAGQGGPSDLIPLPACSELAGSGDGAVMQPRGETTSTWPSPRARCRDHYRQVMQLFQDWFGWLADPEIWLRACAIAAVRDRNSVGMTETPNISDLLWTDRDHAGGDAVRRASGGKLNERPNRATFAPASGSRSALFDLSDRALSPQQLSEGTRQEVRGGLGRPAPCRNSCLARANRPRGRISRICRSFIRRRQQRAYMTLARWIIRTAYALAALGMLSPALARIAFRWSSHLSKKSLALWRSERSERRESPKN